MSTFDGYFERQFGRRIRADRFTQQDPATVLQLLSHAHADHTVGLSSKDLCGKSVLVFPISLESLAWTWKWWLIFLHSNPSISIDITVYTVLPLPET